MGKRNPTSTKGRSRWKSSSENYLLIAEVRFRVKFRVRVMVRVRVRDSKTIFHENYFWWMSNCVFHDGESTHVVNADISKSRHRKSGGKSVAETQIFPES